MRTEIPYATRRHSAILAIPLLMAALVFGCGYDGKEPPYDCDRNPSGFPALAVELIQGIESGRLRTADEVAESFVNLYTAHPTLLHDRTWLGVVQRLGLRLRYRADYLIRDGLLQFAQAGEFYAVAAQIRTDDTLLQERARLFHTWCSAVADPTFDPARLTADDADLAAFTYKMQALARFALGGELHFRFARDYLANALFDSATLDTLRTGPATAGMTPPEIALMAALGLLTPEFDSTLISFNNPAIDIPAVRVVPLPFDSARIEVYFLPREPLTVDLNVSLWVETPDPILPLDKQPRFPFDFSPTPTTSTWQPGQVALAQRKIGFRYPVSALHIGLYDLSDGTPKYLPIAGSRSPRARVSVTPDTPTP